MLPLLMDGNLHYCIWLYLYIVVHSAEGQYFCMMQSHFSAQAKLDMAPKSNKKLFSGPQQCSFFSMVPQILPKVQLICLEKGNNLLTSLTITNNNKNLPMKMSTKQNNNQCQKIIIIEWFRYLPLGCLTKCFEIYKTGAIRKRTIQISDYVRTKDIIDHMGEAIACCMPYFHYQPKFIFLCMRAFSLIRVGLSSKVAQLIRPLLLHLGTPASFYAL